ncbi:MAG: hypothetical protein U0840_24905 [Gemmataceae bacterium]
MASLKNRNTSLKLETLEERANPSSFVDPTTRDVVVNMGNGNDTLYVYEQPGWIRVVENGVTSWYSKSYAYGGDVVVRCGGGNDYVNNMASSLRLTAYGQWGNDTLIGDAQNDYLHGGEDNDILYGYGGNDTLMGRVGYDRLYGMSGNDMLDGGDDGVADYLNGGTGYDRFQQENYWTQVFGIWFQRNRDYPADFTSGQDSFYNY